MMKKSLFALAAAVALLAAARPAAAVDLGLRAGFSLNPDQAVIGGHTLLPIGQGFTLVPNVDVGFGEDMVTLGFHGDLHYYFDTQTVWKPYAGAGATFNIMDGEAFGGGSLIGGLAIGKTRFGNMFLEAKFGLGDVPDFKLLVGFNH